MPATPAQAAAVLNAETELRVSLAEVLYAQAPLAREAGVRIANVKSALIDEATRLTLDDSTDAAANTRDLLRLVRAVQPCVQYLTLNAAYGGAEYVAKATCWCVGVVSAFARIGSGAMVDDIARGLQMFLTEGGERRWEDVAEAVQALHLVVEQGGKVEVEGVVRVVKRVVERIGGGDEVREGGWAVVEILVSIIGMGITEIGVERCSDIGVTRLLRELINCVEDGAKGGETAIKDIQVLMGRLRSEQM